MSAGLTVRRAGGHTTPTFRQLAGASHTLNGVAGIGLLNPLGAMERRVQSRLSFAHRSGSLYDGLGGAPAMEAGSKWPVDQPRSVRHPVIGLARWRVCNPHLESVMSQDNSARASRASRAPVTQTRIHANGTTDSITWIREATAIKRLRRHLAKSGCSLHITREGSPDRQRHGEYFIRDQEGHLIDDKINLEAWLRAYNLMADDERIEPPPEKGWRYFVARHRIVQVDGVNARYAEPISREFTSRSAANRAAQGISDRDDLVLVAYDANRLDGAI